MRNLGLTLVAATALCASTITTKAQTADEIISKHVTAVGGADNWKKINTMKMTASINGGGMEIPVTIVRVHNKAERVEFTVNGMTGYQILTTKEGWNFNPFGGQTKAEPMTADDVKESQDELDLTGDLIDYKTKGNTITLLGKDDVEGTECYKLKVVCKNGKEKTEYIDAANFYHIQTVEKMKADGKEMEMKTTFGNFKKLPSGVVFPMSMESPQGPLAIKDVEINKPVDDNIFKPTDKK